MSEKATVVAKHDPNSVVPNIEEDKTYTVVKRGADNIVIETHEGATEIGFGVSGDMYEFRKSARVMFDFESHEERVRRLMDEHRGTLDRLGEGP